jgi:hypothetical protein
MSRSGIIHCEIGVPGDIGKFNCGKLKRGVVGIIKDIIIRLA